MMLLKLALKNLMGAGLRSWLNAAVISIALVVVIWNQGLLVGMDEQATRAVIDAEAGGGQYWQANYDPYDPLTLEEAHAPLPDALGELVASGRAAAILAAQATIYPQGRMRTALVRGIDPAQTTISVPSSVLVAGDVELPVLIGTRMAKSTGLKKGDTVAVRWREPGGAFNARDARIVEVMSTTVQTIDMGQLWVPLPELRQMLRLPGEASLVVIGKDTEPVGAPEGWTFRDHAFLLSDIRELYESKTVGRTIFFTILMMLGMLAIFDTQVLSIFRRRKEMGTLMALGFTRGRIIGLFTLEGALHSVLAVLLGAVYGIPLLYLQAVKGFAMPPSMDSFGFSLGERIFPVYSAGLVVGVTLLVLAVTTFVSFLPTRKIVRLKPTDALRGRMS